MAAHLPMFPLSTVLFPRSVLPIQVFEPRYLRMVAEVLQGDHTFGVVLIERGWEVGGGDERFNTGTYARIASVREVGDGRLAVLAVGTRRLRVEEWLEDDPYPQATVGELADEDEAPAQPSLKAAQAQLERVYALAAELGAELTTPTLSLDVEDPVAAMWTLCALAPVGQLDRQRLLEMTSAGQRMEAVVELLKDHGDVLSAELGRGG